MAKLYGTGLYGKGNYSALTASSVAAAQGNCAETGLAAALKAEVGFGAGPGGFGLTGPAVLFVLNRVVPAAAGLCGLAGQAVFFGGGNLWRIEISADPSWTPEIPGADSWTPQMAAAAAWNVEQ